MSAMEGLHVHNPPRALLHNWRFVREEEARALAATSHPHADQVAAALASDATIWRFPWPDEDVDAAWLNVEGILSRQLDRAVSIRLPDDVAGVVAQMRHRMVRLETQVGSGRASTSERPCPALTARTGAPRRGAVAEIHGQLSSRMDGATVFHCVPCGTPFILNCEDTTRIATAMQARPPEGWVGRWWCDVANRLRGLRAEDASANESDHLNLAAAVA